MSLQFLDEQKCCQETGCNIHLSCTILGQDLCCRLSTSKSAASRIGEMMILPTKFLASASWQVLKSRSEHCCALCCRNSHHCSHFRQAYFMLPKWVQSSFSFPYSSLLYKGILWKHLTKSLRETRWNFTQKCACSKLSAGQRFNRPVDAGWKSASRKISTRPVGTEKRQHCLMDAFLTEFHLSQNYSLVKVPSAKAPGMPSGALGRSAAFGGMFAAAKSALDGLQDEMLSLEGGMMPLSGMTQDEPTARITRNRGSTTSAVDSVPGSTSSAKKTLVKARWGLLEIEKFSIEFQKIVVMVKKIGKDRKQRSGGQEIISYRTEDENGGMLIKT